MYKLDELAREADVAPRTVRYYVQRGLLPAPEFKGKDTSYGREHLARLLAIKRLQAAHLPLDAIEARLASATLDEIERLASGSVLSVEIPPCDPLHRPRRGRYYFPPPGPIPEVPRAERWERVELVPGLEVHLRSDASLEAQRIAREIRSRYATRIEE